MYWKPSVATDLVIFAIDQGGHQCVLLIERGKEPFRGRLAFPGGFLDEQDQSTEAGAIRELMEETGLQAPPLRCLGVYSDRNRDPRGRVISVPYVGYIHQGVPEVQGSDDAATAAWYRVDHLEDTNLAFDHAEILAQALQSDPVDGSRIYQFRTKYGLSLQDLAQDLKGLVTRQMLHLYEQGKSRPSPKTRAALLAYILSVETPAKLHVANLETKTLVPTTQPQAPASTEEAPAPHR
jgi:ADP-ribose pyrophosphatase YjhB (NUDIX family)/DNA-binding XRE family transcriptional regulator